MSFKFLTNLPSATETVIIIACLHVWTSTSVVLADEANAINHRATTTSKNKWELSPKNAHPRAVALLKDSFYWSILDDDSPFGNDNGADALTAYRKWRNQHRIGTAVDFIRELLTSFQAPLSEWKMLKASDINTFLDQIKGYVLETGDDVIISVAFAELLLDGKIDEEVRTLAQRAIQNEQGLIKWRRWTDPVERAHRLKQMETVLIQASKGG